MGVVSGEMLVDGRQKDLAFQRKTGYVQQQDLHLSTTTVREALRFSALLRQPASVSRQEKIDYVEEVIKLLGMEAYADAVVGVPGEGKSPSWISQLIHGPAANLVQVSMSSRGSVSPSVLSSRLNHSCCYSLMNLPLDWTARQHGRSWICLIP
jgi:ATP-binding cassette subfamily G (WHITE) protein 2 (PDR)